jgi:hypothetical protein
MGQAATYCIMWTLGPAVNMQEFKAYRCLSG